MKTAKDIAKQLNADLGTNWPFGQDKLMTIIEMADKARAAALIEGHEVKLVGIGSLQPVKRAPRNGRNPQTGETLSIPAKSTARLSLGKALRDALNGK